MSTPTTDSNAVLAEELKKQLEVRSVINNASALEIAEKAHDQVLKWLKIRYFWIATVFTVLFPVIGFLTGYVIETKLFNSAQEKMVEEARANIKAAVDGAKSDSEDGKKAIQNGLGEIRAIKHTLEYLSKGTRLGEELFQEKRSALVQEKYDEYTKKLTQLEDDLRKIVPDGYDKLLAQKEEIEKLQRAIGDLKTLFAQNDQAAALAGSLYRIDELAGKFELLLYMQETITDVEIQKIIDNAAKINVKISFYKSGREDSAQMLQWPDAAPTTIVMDSIAEAATTMKGVGKVRDKLLKFSWSLGNSPAWWRAGVDKAPIKQINLLKFSDYDTIRLDIAFPKEIDDARESLYKTRISGKSCPHTIRFNSWINQVNIIGEHHNIDINKNEPYYGEIAQLPYFAGKPAVLAAEGKPAIPLVPERLGTITLTYRKTTTFVESREKYTTALSSDLPRPVQQSPKQ